MARKPRQKKETDDTPRQFKRMMEMQQRLTAKTQKPASRPAPKPKPAAPTSKQGPTPLRSMPKLERQKGESMRDFSRRVDQAIPLPKARGVESRKTARNAQKHKATAENLRAEYHQRWEAKRRRQEELDDENESLTVEDDGEDIWARVNAKAKKPKFGEVADRPPELPRLKQLSSVPKAAGSQARREMLEAERQKVIDQYRKLRGTAPVVEDEPESE